MNRTLASLALVLIAAAISASASGARTMSTLCVGAHAGCYATLQEAVDAAHDGDTITIAPGRYAGGVTIDVSVDIRGAGAGATTIAGGGPVLTLGVEFAATEPTISISGVTVTGGVNTSVPGDPVAQGGGIRIPQSLVNGTLSTGATVTIRDSVVTGNEVAAKALLPPGFCGPVDCSFASGGGISNDGRLTLVDSAVTDNIAGDPSLVTVVASGGGILSTHRSTLTLRHCVISGNRVVGGPPWAGQTNAGGIGSDGPTTIEDSVVSGNQLELSTSLGNDAGPLAFAGGIALSNGSDTIRRTRIDDNVVSGNFAASDGLAFGGGLFIDGDANVVFEQSAADRNRVGVQLPAGSTATALAGGAGISINGIATIRSAHVAHNQIVISAPHGIVGAGGGGIATFGQTTIAQTVVVGNSIDAGAAGGFLDGGGITNTALFGPSSLAVTDSAIVGNALRAPGAVSLRGGGLFTDSPIAVTRTVVAGNRPDQCFGC